jgi:hypothetical protein
VTVKLTNRRAVLDNKPYCLTARWWLPDGFTVRGKQTAVLFHRNSHNPGTCTMEFTLTAGESVAAVNRCVLEIVAEGRPAPMYIPITLLG